MASFNQVILIGNLTRDPQLKHLPSQMAVAEFGMAVNHKYTTAGGEKREEVTFVDCAAFGKSGELISQYCTKGNPLMITGRLRYDSWEDKNGGGKRSKLTVIVDNFQFLGAPDGERTVDRSTSQTQAPRRPSQRPPAESPIGESQEWQEADIPFAWSGRVGQPV